MSAWTPSRSEEGWTPLAQYGVLGDGRTVALVAADGRIDWWPLPAMDSPPAFAAVLDPDRGGFLEFGPVSASTVERRYLPDTNVLETTFRTDGGTVRLTDALTVGTAGPLPWTELVRRIEGVEGAVDMRWSVRPGTRFESAQPWAERRDDAVLAHCGDQHLAVCSFGVGDPVVTDRHVTGGFRCAAGDRAVLGVTASDNAPLYLPRRDDLEDRLDATMAYWRGWAGGVTYRGAWVDAVRRSALMLKLLQYKPTGAVAAAATTSLPERIGGDKNWDYRYMWVRDASFTVDAFLRMGLHEEVHATLTYLLSCIRATTPGLKVFYKLNGDVPGAEATLDAPGYLGSRPVRAGNDAAAQTQLGTFGDLFDSVWRYVDAGHVLDPPTGRLLADLADRCCDMWPTEDAGIWELPVNRHYTVSKMGCWTALDRAVRLHEGGHVPGNHAFRWADERDAIRRWVHRHCWSESKRSFTFYAGTDDLDAATLLAGPNGFDRGPRLEGTVRAIRRELADGALVYRYTGMPKAEGAFLACSFWLASALAVLGRADEAQEQMRAAVATGNDLGVLTEQRAPDGTMLGNLPQALSHLALVNAAHLVDRAFD